jgi:hypothetical protein
MASYPWMDRVGIIPNDMKIAQNPFPEKRFPHFGPGAVEEVGE